MRGTVNKDFLPTIIPFSLVHIKHASYSVQTVTKFINFYNNNLHTCICIYAHMYICAYASKYLYYFTLYFYYLVWLLVHGFSMQE